MDNQINEKGKRSLHIVAYTVTLFFMISALLPVIWMISSALKDNQAIDAYPPQWIPKIPHEVKVTIDYSEQNMQDAVFYEKEAMSATWYPWMANLRENIGEVVIYGIKEGHLIYEAKTVASSFHVGQPIVVPSTLFNKDMMNNKLSLIHERKLSTFSWYGNNGKSVQADSIKSQNVISEKFNEFYTTTDYITGQINSIQEAPKWIHLFDSFLSLNKLAQDKTGTLGILKYFFNSIIVTMSSVVLQMILGGMAGYALSQLIQNHKLKFILLMFFLATIMIPDISLLVPLYLLMNKLHLVNTLSALILPHSAWGIVIYLFKGFFDQLPGDLMQAARVDGASEFRTFSQLVIPLSIPIFTVVAVMTSIPVWNEFVWPLIVNNSPSNWTFTVALNDMQNQSIIQQNTIMASSFVSMIPLFIIFITSQKYIEKGVTFSGVKG